MATGFIVIEPEQKKTCPHEVALALADISEMLGKLEEEGIENDLIDDADATLVRTSWEAFVTTFAYMYLS